MTLALQSAKTRWWVVLRRPFAALARHRDTLVSMLDQGLVSAFSFAVGIGAARIIGIEEFGRFAIALILVAFFQTLHNALFIIPMLSLAGRRAHRSTAYFAAVLMLSTIFALAEGAVVALALAAFFGLRDGTVLIAFAGAGGLLTAAQCSQLTMRRTFFAQGRGGQALAMDALRALAFAIALAALMLTGTPTDAATVLWLLGGSALVVSAGFALLLRASHLGLRLARVVASRHWAVARWMIGLPIITMGQDTFLWVFAGMLFGDAAVGGIRATQYLFGPIVVLMSAIENVVPVRAAAAYGSGGLPSLSGFLRRAGIPLGLAIAGFLLLATVPARFWLATIFGPSYVSFYWVAIVLGAASAVMSLRDYLAQYFRATQKTQEIFYSFVVGAVVTLAITYPLSLAVGLMSIAFATLIGQSASLVYLVAAVIRNYGAGRDKRS